MSIDPLECVFILFLILLKDENDYAFKNKNGEMQLGSR